MRELLSEPMHAILVEAQAAFSSAADAASLENAKALFLGKTGKVTELLKGMAKLSVEDKKTQGAAVNRLKEAIEDALQTRRTDLAEAALQLKLTAEALDVTKPGRLYQNANVGIASQAYAPGLGGLHPVTLTQNRIENIFMTAGFEVVDGPEIETDFHNFTALNTPAHHPARSMHDTFYVDGGRLLRTHTSPIQVRFMQMHKPPIRIIAPGRVYRVDSDATHSPMFHQLEGLWIESQVSFADLKSCFIAFLQAFFETDALQVRFRPSFFPFTEPSAEIDLAFTRGPHQGRWLEVAGAGQVHPNVLQSVGIDAESYTGFAFGVGIERLAMLKYGVHDLRLFYENDLRFLQQFHAA